MTHIDNNENYNNNNNNNNNNNSDVSKHISNKNQYYSNTTSSSSPSSSSFSIPSSSSLSSNFLFFDQNCQFYQTNYNSIFPQKKLFSRLKICQKLTEFEKENIECSIISNCLLSSATKNLTLSKLMILIKSAYFNNVIIDSINSYLIDDINLVKERLKRMEEGGYLDISLSNVVTSTVGMKRNGHLFYSLFLKLHLI